MLDKEAGLKPHIRIKNPYFPNSFRKRIWQGNLSQLKLRNGGANAKNQAGPSKSKRVKRGRFSSQHKSRHYSNTAFDSEPLSFRWRFHSPLLKLLLRPSYWHRSLKLDLVDFLGLRFEKEGNWQSERSWPQGRRNPWHPSAYLLSKVDKGGSFLHPCALQRLLRKGWEVPRSLWTPHGNHNGGQERAIDWGKDSDDRLRYSSLKWA